MSDVTSEIVTGETITDEQIRRLINELSRNYLYDSYPIQAQLRLCYDALEYETMHWIRDDRAVRAKCAELWNAVNAASVPMVLVEARRVELANMQVETDLTVTEANELRDCEITLGMTMADNTARTQAARRVEAAFAKRGYSVAKP